MINNDQINFTYDVKYNIIFIRINFILNMERLIMKVFIIFCILLEELNKIGDNKKKVLKK